MSKQAEFEKLKAIWDAKLKKSGFEDIEQADGKLKRWDSHLFIVHHDEQRYQAKEDYFRLASQFLWEHKFKNKRQKQLWEMHADGMSTREIHAYFKRHGSTLGLNRIQEIIRTLTDKMLIRPK